jgi:hypothetical protein
MPKKAYWPRYQNCRHGWFCQIDGNRILLAKGQNDPHTLATAVVKYWEVTGADVKTIVKLVDWASLIQNQSLSDTPCLLAEVFGPLKLGNEELLMDHLRVYHLTNDQLEKTLIEYGVTREMMAMYSKPRQRKPSKAERLHEFERKRLAGRKYHKVVYTESAKNGSLKLVLEPDPNPADADPLVIHLSYDAKMFAELEKALERRIT